MTQDPAGGGARTRRRAGLAALLLVAAGALLFGIGSSERPPPSAPAAEPAATITRLSGQVRAGPDAAGRALAAGQTVQLGEQITTGPGASLDLTTAVGGIKLALGADTAAVLADRGELHVAMGSVEATVPDIIFALVTPHGRVVGRQSGLGVHVGTLATDVEVTAGDALVLPADGQSQKLPAGRKVTLVAGAHP